jgi:IS30 family transposase
MTAQREQFWALHGQGRPLFDIAAELQVAIRTVYCWIGETGGVRPRVKPAPSGRYLSAEDRDKIAVMVAEGATRAEIARKLGRHRSTIGREIERNSDLVHSATDTVCAYYAGRAQKRAEVRTRRPKVAKLRSNVNPELHVHVQTKLTARWSPEQISKHLPEDFPDRPEMRVSPETIYQAIYVQGRGALRRELAVCLRTGRAVRRPKKRSDTRRGRIPGMINISERPAEVEDRSIPGHWEGDLILGKDNASAIGTLVERTTRYVMLLHLPGRHGALDIEQAMLDAVARMPEDLRKTLTWDQGSEMSNHARIAIATGLDIYFCDPHSPWQRGSNENTNGLLRQYFPKGTDLSSYSAEHLREVAAQLNGRPRKTLGWKSPHEALNQLLVATTD